MNIHTLHKQAGLITSFIKTSWQRHIAYRFGSIIYIVNGFIIPLVLMGVWLTVRKHNQLAFDNGQIITYYLLSILVVRLTQSWTGEDLGFMIYRGELSNFLLKPLSIWTPALGKDIALKGVRILSLLPFLLIFFLLFKNNITISWNLSSISLFLSSIVIGFLLNFLMQNSVGLLAFWFTHHQGLNSIYRLISGLFSGIIIPLTLMPDMLATISKLSPFRFLVSFPIEILMNTAAGKELIFGFFVAAFWTIFFVRLQILIYNKGIRKYSAIGI